ncbi:hypothetical protein G9A89_016995 [Geosiphon pyriformis]|nr:hypothetical protein G9A89_016995 [Geosiphon pyriformis]
MPISFKAREPIDELTKTPPASVFGQVPKPVKPETEPPAEEPISSMTTKTDGLEEIITKK